MCYVSIRDMRIKPGEVWQRLRREGELVVTNNGRPVAVLASVDDDPEEVLRSFRAVRAHASLSRVRDAAARAGVSRLSVQEIADEVKAVRAARSAT
ncbi:MAG: type II toxin-antitoxin system prevent-host-death family antitoxin [Armatimonadetes bacterium]|nr:type II toxin-antitoxin system prevent-host-death family antitoxin [Armatimonadota bacterium]